MDYKETLKKYIYERDNRKCWFCNKELLYRQISLDHYLPKSKEGPRDIFNFVLSCKKCNKLKENRIPTDYEEVLLKNFKQAVVDKKIKSSIGKLKYEELVKISEAMAKIESINDDYTVFQGKTCRMYVKNNHVFKIIALGNGNA